MPTSISLLVLSFVLAACCTPVRNYTVSVVVPAGVNATYNNSSANFCVVPAPWFGVMLFYLGNYASHAATLVTYPGEDPIYIGAAIIYALFFPTSGIVRGLNAIFRRARLCGSWKSMFLEESELRVAARAGALCMVVRSEKWKREDSSQNEQPDSSRSPSTLNEAEAPNPPQGEEKHNDVPLPPSQPAPKSTDAKPTDHKSEQITWRIIEGYWCKELPRLWPYFDTSLERPEPYIPEKDEKIWRKLLRGMTRMERKIHGTIVLPKNGYYSLAYVPRHAKLETFNHVQNANVRYPTALSSSYSFVKATIAIIQVLYASATVYKATQGPQIDHYGYAAFGLTVIPYLIMSLINLTGNIVTPNYDSLYLVHSEILDEAVNEHGAVIDGAVGRLVAATNKQEIEVEDNFFKKASTKHFVHIGSNKKPTNSDSADSSGSKTRRIEMDTSGVTHLCSKRQGSQGYNIAFSCPTFERIDFQRAKKSRPTRILEEPHPGKTWGGYFNPANRLDIAIPWYSYFFFTFISLLIGSLSLLPMGLLSKLHEQSSTHEQRVWISCWTVFGFVIGTLAGFWTSALDYKSSQGEGLTKWWKFLGKLLFAAFFAAPGVGGFIMVGKMLREYGNCVNLF